LDSANNSAASDKGHTGALYSKNSDPAAEVGVVLFTTALGLCGGELWGGEFQGLVIHELVPIWDLKCGCYFLLALRTNVPTEWTDKLIGWLVLAPIHV
jgi:hypothetical protein